MPEELSRVVAARISRALEERGMTGRALAAATGIPQPSLARKLRGDSPFDLDDLPPIARVLEIPVSEIVSQK